MGKEKKKVDCSRFWTMLYLEKQKCTEATKTEKISTVDSKYFSVHKDTKYLYKRDWQNDVKWHLML